jgi:hypothetical protein
MPTRAELKEHSRQKRRVTRPPITEQLQRIGRGLLAWGIPLFVTAAAFAAVILWFWIR